VALAALPRRDRQAREHLDALARRVRPVVFAHERAIPVAGGLGELLPMGGLQRGAVVAVDGARGAGATTVALQLAAAATAAGEWAAAVDPDATLGGLAAAETGVEPERFVVVRGVPAERWAGVVAALLDGVALVLAAAPPGVKSGDARRLVARARERDAVLVALGAWPVEAAVRLRADGGAWSGLGHGTGLLRGRTHDVALVERGAGTRSRTLTTTDGLARAG
jgi:RecA/RadA recombinase